MLQRRTDRQTYRHGHSESQKHSCYVSPCLKKFRYFVSDPQWATVQDRQTDGQIESQKQLCYVSPCLEKFRYFVIDPQWATVDELVQRTDLPDQEDQVRLLYVGLHHQLREEDDDLHPELTVRKNTKKIPQPKK